MDKKYKEGDYVEHQPMHGKQPRGRSKNVRITKVLSDGRYETNIGKTISHKEILGQNLKFLSRTKENITMDKKLKLEEGKRFTTSAMDEEYTVFDNKTGSVVKKFPYAKDEEFSKKARKAAYAFTKQKNEAVQETINTDKKLKLITGAQDKAQHDKMIVERIDTFAGSFGEDPKKLLEGATQVLAGLKTLISQGEPLTKTGLSPASLAGVVAGIQVLVNNVGKLEPAKKTKVLNVLGTLALGAGMSLQAVQAIAALAEKNPNRPQLQQAFDSYSKTSKPDQNLVKSLGQLQQQVDQATRTASIDQPTAPVSGAASNLGQPQ